MASKYPLDVYFHDVQMALFKQLIHAPQRILATASGPEPIALSGELALKDWFYNHSQGGLYDAVEHRRYSQRPPFRAPWFGYPYPFDRLGLIGSPHYLLFNGEQPLWALFVKETYRDAVHATGPGVGLHLLPSNLKSFIRIELVYEAKPLVSFNPRLEGSQHPLTPDTAFGPMAQPWVFFFLFIHL